MSWYRTGTISLTNGSTAVTGAGTDFISGCAIGEGVLAPDGRVYEISAIVSALSLTLGSPYLGATAAGQSYAIEPTQSYIRDLAAQAASLVNGFATTRNNALLTTAADKPTPIDADALALRDSVTGLARLLSWANLKATLLASLKDTSGGLAGLTLFKLNLRNAANTITSWFTNAATVARTWTFPDKDGTVAMTSDITDERAVVATLTNKTLTAPVLTGNPIAPTAALGNNNTSIATTAFVQQEITDKDHTSLTAAPGKTPVSDAGALLDPSWLENNQTYQRLMGAIAFATDLAGHAAGSPLVLPFATPSGTTVGNPGNVAFDASYLYICTAKNVWKRVALTSF